LRRRFGIEERAVVIAEARRRGLDDLAHLLRRLPVPLVAVRQGEITRPFPCLPGDCSALAGEEILEITR
jgi:hypothetical protein